MGAHAERQAQLLALKQQFRSHQISKEDYSRQYRALVPNTRPISRSQALVNTLMSRGLPVSEAKKIADNPSQYIVTKNKSEEEVLKELKPGQTAINISPAQITQVEEQPSGNIYTGKETTIRGTPSFIGVRQLSQEEYVQQSRQYMTITKPEAPRPKTDIVGFAKLPPEVQIYGSNFNTKVTYEKAPITEPQNALYANSEYAERAQALVQREKKVNEFTQGIITKLGLQENPEDEKYTKPGLGFNVKRLKTTARTVVSIPSSTYILGGRVAFAAESVFHEEGRKELGEAFGRVVPALKEQYNPSTEQGMVNIGMAAVSVYSVAKSPSNLGTKAYNKLQEIKFNYNINKLGKIPTTGEEYVNYYPSVDAPKQRSIFGKPVEDYQVRESIRAATENKIGYGIDKNTLKPVTQDILPSGQTKLMQDQIIAVDSFGNRVPLKVVNNEPFVYEPRIGKWVEFNPQTAHLRTINPNVNLNTNKVDIAFRETATQQELIPKGPTSRDISGIYATKPKTIFSPRPVTKFKTVSITETQPAPVKISELTMGSAMPNYQGPEIPSIFGGSKSGDLSSLTKFWDNKHFEAFGALSGLNEANDNNLKLSKKKRKLELILPPDYSTSTGTGYSPINAPDITREITKPTLKALTYTKQNNFSTTKSELSGMTRQSSRERQIGKQDQKPIQRAISIQNIKTEQKSIIVQKQESMQQQKIETVQIQRQKAKQLSFQMRASNYSFSTSQLTKADMPSNSFRLMLPPITSGPSRSSSRSGFNFRFSQPKQYMPTVYASLAKLTATKISKSGVMTGLGPRPFIIKKGRKLW